jgi:chromosome transmission fidelity protein 1
MHQVSGYGNKSISTRESGEHISQEGSIISDFQSMADILLSLMNNNTDGRVVVLKQKSSSEGAEECCLKFVMLSGEKIFSEVFNIHISFNSVKRPLYYQEVANNLLCIYTKR